MFLLKVKVGTHICFSLLFPLSLTFPLMHALGFFLTQAGWVGSSSASAFPACHCFLMERTFGCSCASGGGLGWNCSVGSLPFFCSDTEWFGWSTTQSQGWMVKLYMASTMYEMKSHILLKDQLQIRAVKEWMPNCSDVGRSESIIRYMASLEGFSQFERGTQTLLSLSGFVYIYL
ncbi:uncharacterized protein [Triticum aestivum]|uniref:uncharacterized protein isoform X1 n=1 Tax=Triticum aestivum TaxID=4565 RepID=UPI001D00B5BF|nr:uncharacterized protein LOC123041033 isoform X1 [Triticum aestivum]